MKCLFVPGTCTIIACGTDGTKLLAESVSKTVLQSLFWAPAVYQDSSMHHDWPVNPLSPSIHIQILQTDLHTFPLRISWENLIKRQGTFSFVIIFYILTTLPLDNVWTLLGENCCWSLLEIKGLRVPLLICQSGWRKFETYTSDSLSLLGSIRLCLWHKFVPWLRAIIILLFKGCQ